MATMNSSTIPLVQCLPGYKPTALGVPAAFALFLTVPLCVIGTLLNGFALVLLSCQKQFTNQDIYVTALSACGMIMAGPCLFLFTYGNVKLCYDFPQIVSDLRIFLVQLSAGVSIWLVVMISIDRLLMLYFKVHYPQRVTKRRTLIGIGSLVLYYVIVCSCIDASPYFLGTYKVRPLSWHPRYAMVASFVETPTQISYALNLMRMVTDRMLPWIICTATYITIFALRDRHKKKMNPGIQPTMVSQMNSAGGTAAISGGGGASDPTSRRGTQLFQPAASKAGSSPHAPKLQQRSSTVEQRIKRSRFLVIGITTSLFVCLTPETVFDISSYIFGVVLRKGVWEILGVVWYLQTILNPVIYIMQFPHLRSKAKQLLKLIADKLNKICVFDKEKAKKRMCHTSTKTKSANGTSVIKPSAITKVKSLKDSSSKPKSPSNMSKTEKGMRPSSATSSSPRRK